MVKVGNMRRAGRILLIAGMLVLSVGGASASPWRHRAPKKPEQTPAAPAATAAMTLNAIEVGSSASQIVLRTSGAPAFTSLSPTPDQFVIDLSATTKSTTLTIPSPLPAGVSSITADEVTEMGGKLTRVTMRMSQPGTAQAAADGNSVVVTLPAPPAVVEPASVPVMAAPMPEAPKVAAEPTAKSDSKPLPKAKSLKNIETSGTGAAIDVQIATDGDASYSAFKLASPAR